MALSCDDTIPSFVGIVLLAIDLRSQLYVFANQSVLHSKVETNFKLFVCFYKVKQAFGILRRCERLVTVLLPHVFDSVEADELSTAKSFSSQELNALLRILGRINHKRLKHTNRSGDCTIVLLLNRAQVTQSTSKALNLPSPRCLFQRLQHLVLRLVLLQGLPDKVQI